MSANYVKDDPETDVVITDYMDCWHQVSDGANDSHLPTDDNTAALLTIAKSINRLTEAIRGHE